MHRLKGSVEIALCAAVIAALSQVLLPLPGGVPMTLQILGVAFCGFFLGAKKAGVAVALYLLLGAVGLPVFSAFSGGVGRLIDPAGGFLFGFLPLAFFCGVEGGRVKRGLFAVCGLLICHGVGAAWYAFSSKVSLEAAVLTVTLPTFWKDLLLLFVADLLGERLRKILKK